MATIVGNTYLTLADLYKRQNKQGEIQTIIELLAETNPILQDLITIPCNQGATHLTTMRTGLPEITFRKLYQGVQPAKSNTAQVTDTTGMIEARSIVDKALLDISENPGGTRLSEAAGFLEAMNQTWAQHIFYGDNTSAPEKFLGLAPRFNSLSAKNGSQIVDAGGKGNKNTSIWFIVWGDNTVHGLYPKGTTAGIKREDLGEQQITDENGGRYSAMEEKFTLHFGMSVRDYRYVSRIANIDVAALQAGKVPLYDFMRQAYYKLHQRTKIGGKAAIYCNKDVLEALDALATNAGANDNFVRLTRKDVEGEEILSYRGIPLRQSDALVNTESQVK